MRSLSALFVSLVATSAALAATNEWEWLEAGVHGEPEQHVLGSSRPSFIPQGPSPAYVQALHEKIQGLSGLEHIGMVLHRPDPVTGHERIQVQHNDLLCEYR